MQLLVGHQSVKRSFQFANVGLDATRDVGNDLIRNSIAQKIGLYTEDGHSCFQIRWLNIGDQTPFKAGAQAFFQAHNCLWWPVTTDDDLLAHLIQAIERMEE